MNILETIIQKLGPYELQHLAVVAPDRDMALEIMDRYAARVFTTQVRKAPKGLKFLLIHDSIDISALKVFFTTVAYDDVIIIQWDEI